MATTQSEVSSLSGTQPVKVTTKNTNGFANAEDGDGNPIIKVEFNVSVPGNFQESLSYFGGEEKVQEILTQEVVRRKANLARPILRDAETELDWETVATEAAEGYVPGRRGGFQPRVDKNELDGMTSDEIIAVLQARGMLKVN